MKNRYIEGDNVERRKKRRRRTRRNDGRTKIR
jgi:hypothetical protein